MEIIMKTDMEHSFPSSIEYNHEDIKAELSMSLEKYNNIVVTEEGIKEAKADRAKLNKLKSALDSKRKEVKNLCLAPYIEFETNINELIEMVDKPIKAIDVQIKEFENTKKESKRKDIEVVYCDNIEEFKELIPLENIFKNKWLNATYKMSDIALEIESIVVNARSALSFIDSLNTEFKAQITDVYFQTLDINKVIAENKRLTEFSNKQKEFENTSNVKKDVIQEREELKLMAIEFRVFATPEQFKALKEFLISNGIKYGKIK